MAGFSSRCRGMAPALSAAICVFAFFPSAASEADPFAAPPPVMQGPRLNPEGMRLQFLEWLDPVPGAYSNLVKLGFNTFLPLASKHSRRRWLDMIEADGADYIEMLRFARCAVDFIKAHPQIGYDGKPRYNMVADAGDPAVREGLKKMAEAVLADIPDHPAFVGIQPTTEVLDGMFPSFSKGSVGEWKKFSGGEEIPKGVRGRIAPHYLTLADFPADRVVSPDYPLMRYYDWFWKNGGGWNIYMSEATEVFEKSGRFRRPLFSGWDPCTRQPPVFGAGGKVSTLSHWIYAYPSPLNVAYLIAEEAAMARGRPGQEITAEIQSIAYRSAVAPMNVAVANPPAWMKDRPEAKYITMPPDMMREAIWTLLSRRIAGTGSHGWNSIMDGVPFGKDRKNGYQYTHPGLGEVFRELYLGVIDPLGPLFRAMPELPMEYAQLESRTSTYFANRGTWGWRGPILHAGIVATAANLSPHVLYEEELEKNGVPSSVRVLSLPDCECLSKGAFDAVRRFQLSGGIIIADERVVPGILPDFGLPRYEPTEAADKDDKALRAAALELRGLLAPFYRPKADSSRDDIVTHLRGYRASRLLFAINDRRRAGDYVGQWNRVLEKGVPNEGTVSAEMTAGAVYDIVRHEPVPFTVRDGRTYVDVRFATSGGHAFLLSPRPLAPLSLRRRGDEIAVVSSDEDVMIPVSVTAPGRKPYYGVVKDGVFRPSVFRCPADVPVTVTNLADGSTLTGGPRPRAAGPVPSVFVRKVAECGEAVRSAARRAAFRKEVAADAGTAEKHLSDSDERIRRAALWEIFARDREAGIKTARGLFGDPSASVGSFLAEIGRAVSDPAAKIEYLQSLAARTPNPATKQLAGKLVGFPFYRLNVAPSQDPSVDREFTLMRKIDLPVDGWAFTLDKYNQGFHRSPGFYLTGYTDTSWKRISVGKSWEEQGYPGYDGIAWYRLHFTLPPKPEGAASVELCFDGVDEEAWVWVNGTYLGQHAEGLSGWDKPFRFDVSQELKWGAKNLLVVRVGDSSQDGGIWRPVRIEVLK